MSEARRIRKAVRTIWSAVLTVLQRDGITIGEWKEGVEPRAYSVQVPSYLLDLEAQQEATFNRLTSLYPRLRRELELNGCDTILVKQHAKAELVPGEIRVTLVLGFESRAA